MKTLLFLNTWGGLALVTCLPVLIILYWIFFKILFSTKTKKIELSVNIPVNDDVESEAKSRIEASFLSTGDDKKKTENGKKEKSLHKKGEESSMDKTNDQIRRINQQTIINAANSSFLH
jgi:hypothetical protein